MITRTRTLGGLPAASAAATEDRGEAGAEDEGDDARQPNPEPGMKGANSIQLLFFHIAKLNVFKTLRICYAIFLLINVFQIINYVVVRLKPHHILE